MMLEKDLATKTDGVPEEIEDIEEIEGEEKVESIGDFYYINETFRIDKDSRQYILQRKCKTQKLAIEKEFWVNVGFFPELKWLYHHLVELRIRETSLNDLKAIYTEAQKLHDEINKKYP